jgi:hypothetical protein
MSADNLLLTDQERTDLGALAQEFQNAQNQAQRSLLAVEGLIGRFARAKGVNLLEFDLAQDLSGFVPKVQDAQFGPVPNPNLEIPSSVVTPPPAPPEEESKTARAKVVPLKKKGDYR